MQWLKRTATWGLLLVACAAGAEQSIEQQLKERLKTSMPEAKVTGVKPAAIAGLYEVMLGPTVLYMTADGRYAFRGDIFDLQGRSNLTSQRRVEARQAAFHAAEQGAIEFAPADGKIAHTLYVFTDVDCGYCRKMHGEIGKLNAAGIAVKYFAFPRTGLNSESFNKAVTVWCSADKKEALTLSKQGRELAAKTCPNPVAAQYELGQSMGVHGTPAVYLEDGHELGGYVPAAELIKMFADGQM